MGKSAAFIAEFLQDGHLSIPDKAIKTLSLRKGSKVRAVIETQKFDKDEFLKLSGIWEKKTMQELSIFQDIIKERENFGRGVVKL